MRVLWVFLKLGWKKIWVLCKRAKIRKNNLRILKVLKLAGYARYALNFSFLFRTKKKESKKIFLQEE